MNPAELFFPTSTLEKLVCCMLTRACMLSEIPQPSTVLEGNLEEWGWGGRFKSEGIYVYL